MNPHRGNPEDITEAYYRGLMHSVGYRLSDLDKPQIAVVNSWTDVNPGHQPLKELAQRIKEGIWASGGLPLRIRRPRPCDGMAQGPGMHYILPQRDLIAGSIEAMVGAHGFEGLVMLGSCDKIPPGMLMAAVRLNLPTLFLTAGAMMPCRMVRDFLLNRTVKPGSVLVVRYEGPKGGPGMRELSIPAAMLVGMGLHISVTMVTAGRFSGATRGPCVGHFCPKPWDDGPIAYVHNGDQILIDFPEGRLELLIPETELAKRRRKRAKKPDHPAPGVLAAYRKGVGSADKGALWL